MRGCDFPGCKSPHMAKGLCMGHYYQKRRGSPMTPLGPSRRVKAAEIALGVKTCQRCKTQKPISEYGANNSKTDRLQHCCKDCQKILGWSWRYNLTPEEIWLMAERQQGLCGMCKLPYQKWCIDHDHSCCPGNRSCGLCVRGLLCGICNRILGQYEKFKDAAEAYLAKAPL